MSKKSYDPFLIPPQYLISLFLVVITLLGFSQSFNHDFINFDDDIYVSENPHVQDGLNWDGVKWAFTADLWGDDPNSDFWIPLTFLSHMITVEFFGINPSWHHIMNVMLHVLNTVFLFLVLRRMTGGLWQSAFAASLFAIHPLHVESVAWVTERKDVLSGLFFMLILWAYTHYCAQPSLIRYLSVILLFAMGLMAKPILVTLPMVLLLLDYWPLGRISIDDIKRRGRNVWMLLLEKTPLLFLSIISAVITYLATQRAGAVGSLQVYSLSARIVNALVSYVGYIGKMFWPTSLAVFYPYPGESESIMDALGATSVLVALSILAVRWIRSRPYFIVGWLWFLGMLVPVIGILQAGTQASADRYTYLPYIGLFCILSWGAADLSKKWPYRQAVLSVGGGIILALFMVLSFRQVGYWKNSITLFEHAVRVTENNYLAHTNLGFEYRIQGRTEEALREFHVATEINPAELIPQVQTGLAYSELNRFEDAIKQFQWVLRINPNDADTHYYLGKVYTQIKRTQDAIQELQTALHLEPDHHKARGWLGLANLKAGFGERAISEIQLAISLAPDDPDHYTQLGLYYLDLNRLVQAKTAFQEAIRRDPKSTAAYNNLGLIYKDQGKPDAAIDAYRMAIQLDPDASEPHVNLALIYVRQERYPEAIQEYLIGIKRDPGNFAAQYNLGLAYERLGNYQNAKNHYQKALRIQDGDERTRKALERIANPSD